MTIPLGLVFPPDSNTTHNAPRILLLTAHPDDETFFFGPTLTALIPSFATSASASSRNNDPDTVTLTSPQVYSLCLSVGNADGLGDTRRREFGGSLDVLGVAEERRWILDNFEFQDDMNAKWDASLIADTILTFDSYGVSGHPNHFSLYHGVSRLLAASPAGIGHPLVAYSLKSKPVIIKYIGILGPVLIKSKVILSRALDIMQLGRPVGPVFVAGIKEYRRTVIAALRHQSQRVWFRWLYMAFSQYMWANEWERIHIVV
ncbi:putative deacetylase LmbE-like domain-containing protein [Russula vinacea]|nr:putative deacetylase LmbE-like domain-containing protein [Russula vinacea]